MHPIITEVRKQLKAHSDSKTKQSGERFFKEKVRSYGVKSAVVGKIAKETFEQLNTTSKQDIFNLCTILWQSGMMEESFVACSWAYALHKRYAESDFALLESWVRTYVSNWASCDTLCNHTVGTFLEMYPAYIARLKSWTASENRWVRRAAAVSLIVPAKEGKFLSDVFKIADLLLRDEDDMVQKGYGWMLKVASNKHQSDVFAYIMKHKIVMPRTALRYAIEKMPASLKAQAMKKQKRIVTTIALIT